MSNKSEIDIDNILRGIPINKNNEIDYIAHIDITLYKDVPFEYVVADEGIQDDSFIPFTSAKKQTTFEYRNIDGEFKKKVLYIKSSEKCKALIQINVEKILTAQNIRETLGERRTLQLSQSAVNDGTTEKTDKKEWYKDPMVIGVAFVIIAIIAIIVLQNRKKDNSSRLFV